MGNFMVLDDGSLYRTDITTIFFDAMFKYRGLSIMAEYANREADMPLAMLQGETETFDYAVLEGSGVNFQTSYLFKNNYEITGRYSKNDYKEVSQTLDLEQYTLGASKYIVGHKLKVQSDVVYSRLNDINDNITWRIGFDFHF